MAEVEILSVRDYESITPQQLYEFDRARGELAQDPEAGRVWQVFDGPTTEEILEWDELSVRMINEAYSSGKMPDKVYRREVPEEFEGNYAGFLATELHEAQELSRHLRTIWKIAGPSRPRGICEGMNGQRATIHKQGGN